MQPRVAIAGLLVSFAACGRMDDAEPTSPLAAEGLSASVSAEGGVVFTQSNAPAGNAVLVFDRAPDGTLAAAGLYPTGGSGTGAGLGSQGAVTLSDDGKYLLVVNAHSDDVTAFRVRGDRLDRLNTVPSGGTTPISVTVRGGLVYVLNAGGAGNIAGFTLGQTGLTPVSSSVRPLSSAAAGPAQISFTPDGTTLVVTEKMANAIATYHVDLGGRAQGPVVTPSAGQTPFGFSFAHGALLIVSEAFGGATDASAASSYVVRGTSVSARSSSVPTTETAACWFVTTPDDRYAYTANTGSGTVTGYRIIAEGRLQRLDADGRTGVIGVGSAPTDEALARGGQYLYVLASGTHAVAQFRVAVDGSLSSVGSLTGLPVGAVGLASR